MTELETRIETELNLRMEKAAKVDIFSFPLVVTGLNPIYLESMFWLLLIFTELKGCIS